MTSPRLRFIRRVRREAPLVLLDLAIVVPAYLAPLAVRFDGRVPGVYWSHFRVFLPLIVLLHLSANYLFGLYGQMWRYAGVQEARRVLLAGLTATALILAATYSFGASGRPLPISVVLFGALLSFLGFGAIRFQNRLFGYSRRIVAEHRSRLLQIGAGDAGAMILKDVLEHSSLGLDPVGIVDDDRRKLGRSLHGVRVLGGRSSIPELIQRLSIEVVLLAIPSADSELVREVASICEESEVTLRVLPSVREIVDGRVSARDIRDVSINDLLGRLQVETDLGAVEQMVQGRRVLVTGAGGSIGSEISRQVAGFSPSSLLLLDHDETHLHDLTTELEGTPGVTPVLTDVRDRARIRRLFAIHRPEVVFHAAAHKHVPILEAYPEEALFTNVLGTTNVAEAAVLHGAHRFVLISTDKAIRPAGVMGASKRLAELVVRSLTGDDLEFCAVRFGNVLGSRGSVIPTFFRQIQRGGPVTVTDPAMTRYFMSVQEAVQLVLQAATLSRGGEVFTLDMGEPVNIMDLARKLVRLSGRVADRDVSITVTGVRPGEKLHEELQDPEEEFLASPHPAIRVSRPPIPEREALDAAVQELVSLARQERTEEFADRLKAAALGPIGSAERLAG